MSLSVSTRRSWVKPDSVYSIRRQCRLAGVPRSGIYYNNPVPETDENLLLMRLIDEQYMRHPEFGYPRMTDWLRNQEHCVNQKRVARLMQRMRLQAIL
jgi:putative transposase